jgi:putative drug exporter of the RND superfamily
MFEQIAAFNAFSRLPRLARMLTPARASRLVIATWLLVLPLAGMLSGRLYGIQNNDATQYLPRSAESTQVYTALAKQSSQAPLIATVVYVRESGITAADRAKAATDGERFRRYAGDVTVAPPIPSRDGRALMLNVPLVPALAAVVPTVAALRAAAAGGSPAGLQTSVTGPAGYAADFAGAFGSLDQHLLMMTVAVVAVILLVTYRSPVLWLVPLVTVGIGYTAAAAIVYEFATRLGLVISGETLGILPVLVFGAGTDYALLLIARYREELQRHADRGAAMIAALRRAVPAMLASAATVSISLLCLLAAELNSNRGLGPTGAIGIACTFLASVTLLPAILLVAGRRVFWPFVPRPGSARPATATVWGRIGRRLGRRPRLAWMPVVGTAGRARRRIGPGPVRFEPDTGVPHAAGLRVGPGAAERPLPGKRFRLRPGDHPSRQRGCGHRSRGAHGRRGPGAAGLRQWQPGARARGADRRSRHP